jgi:hypothetical protein
VGKGATGRAWERAGESCAGTWPPCRRSNKSRQRAKDLGGDLRLLPIESGTVARTYPFSRHAGAGGRCAIAVAASAVVTFTTAALRNKHRARVPVWNTRAGKGYSLRVLLLCKRFGNRLRAYGIGEEH